MNHFKWGTKNPTINLSNFFVYPPKGDLEFVLEVKLPSHMLSTCHDSLPRPPFENYLFYLGLSSVTFLILIMLVGSFVESRSINKYQYNLRKQILKIFEERQFRMQDFLSHYQMQSETKTQPGANTSSSSSSNQLNGSVANSAVNPILTGNLAAAPTNGKSRERKSMPSTHTDVNANVKLLAETPAAIPDSPRQKQKDKDREAPTIAAVIIANNNSKKQANSRNLTKSLSSPKTFTPEVSTNQAIAPKNANNTNAKSSGIQSATKKQLTAPKENEPLPPPVESSTSARQQAAVNVSPRAGKKAVSKRPTPTNTPPPRPSPAVSPSLLSSLDSLNSEPSKDTKIGKTNGHKQHVKPLKIALKQGKSANANATANFSNSNSNSNNESSSSLTPSPQANTSHTEFFKKPLTVSTSLNTAPALQQHQSQKRNSTDAKLG